MKFRLWYYGDLKCYSITSRDNKQRLNFYSTNGASYYTGVVYTGDVAQIKAIIPQKKDEKYLRKKFASEQPSPSNQSTSNIQEKDKQATSPAHRKDAVTSSSSGGTLSRLARNCPGCNLSGAQLKEADLVNANLSGADLSGADLRYANLRRANLQGANLSGARLNHANLPGANMSGCNLSYADLSGANLLLADVTGADLKGAILAGAYLENIKGLKDN
ncbi:MAG: pentapeptide repeat-containing protein [Deltaproteobacteria bacterium]|nr:pentapeptide repeat-containing protein [Deltaproteobacteria bacterium]